MKPDVKLVVLLSVLGLVGFAVASMPQTGEPGAQKKAWVKFDGKADVKGQGYSLVSTDGKGEIEAPADAVKVDGDTVQLKVGSTVKVIRNDVKPKNEGTKATEGCRKDQCIGLVKICCDDRHIINACVGAWGCG